MSELSPMLHRDARHTGVAPGVGRIPCFGPVVMKWEFRVAPPVTPATLSCYRFYSGFPLVDLDGNGTLDVVVTGPDNAIGPDCPRPGGPPLVVSAGGKGRAEANQTGSYGVCTPDARGWVGAFRHDGTLAWTRRYVGEGNIRASCAVADLDGDGHYEVVVPFGCRGQVRCYGDDGTERWTYQLGDPAAEWTQRSIGSPSIGDIDGDGFLEVIVSAFDGKVYCLGAP